MSTETVAPRKKSWISLVLKIAFFFAAFLLLTLTIMSNLGGSGEALRKSIEDFVGENTSYTAEVGQLNAMTFFPDIGFDFENTEFTKKSEDVVSMYLGHAQIVFGFWDVMGSTGKIKKLNIKEFKALAGTILEKELFVESIEILETVEEPRLEARGTINNIPFDFSCGVESKGLGKGKKYSFGNQRDFEFILGDVKVTGRLRGGRNTGLLFEDLQIFSKNQKVAIGKIGIVRNDKRYDIRGAFTLETHKTNINPDMQINLESGTPEVKGVLESAEFHTEDFAKGSGYDQIVTVLENVFGVPETTSSPDLKLRINTFYKDGKALGFYHAPAPIKGWRLDVESIKPEPKTLSSETP